MLKIDEIHLSDSEYRSFCAASRGRSIQVRQAERLTYFGLVDVAGYVGGNRRAVCTLTDKGRRYRDYMRHRRNDMRFNRILAVIAIVIAIGSLIVSVIALMK